LHRRGLSCSDPSPWWPSWRPSGKARSPRGQPIETAPRASLVADQVNRAATGSGAFCYRQRLAERPDGTRHAGRSGGLRPRPRGRTSLARRVPSGLPFASALAPELGRPFYSLCHASPASPRRRTRPLPHPGLTTPNLNGGNSICGARLRRRGKPPNRLSPSRARSHPAVPRGNRRVPDRNEAGLRGFAPLGRAGSPYAPNQPRRPCQRHRLLGAL
jgi:hypothetical protein